MEETLQFLQSLDAETVNLGQLKSIRHGFLVAGDVMYIPPGALLVEKAVGATNIALRTASMVLAQDSSSSTLLIAAAHPK